MKRVLSLITLLLVALTLVSCGKQSSLNTNVPTGNLSTDAYATLGDKSISNKDLYLEMRGSAYDVFVSELKKLAINPADLGLDPNSQEVTDLINEACYSTKEVNELNASTKKSYEDRFKDSMALLNIDATDIYSDAVRNYYVQELAYEVYAEKQITTETSKYYFKNEYLKNSDGFILDADGNKQANPYHVADEDFETYYNNNMKNEKSIDVIILGFKTLNEAQYFFNSETTAIDNYGELTTTTPKAAFEAAYRKVFGLADTQAVPTTLTSDELAEYSSVLTNAINNLETDQYTTRAILAGSMKYFAYVVAPKQTVEYADLTAEQKAEVQTKKIHSLVGSTAVTAIVNDLLNNSELVINDPLLSKLYKAANANYEELTADKWTDASNNLVASLKVNGTNKELSVEKFFGVLKSTFGPITASKYFEQVLLLEKYTSLLTESDLSEIENAISTTKTSFEEGSLTDYPSSLTTDEFNLMYYGSTTAEDVTNKLKVQKIITYLQTKYDESDTETGITSILEKFGKHYYEKYFSLKIVHILISSDKNMTGSMDDPELVEVNKEHVTLLANAVLAEAKYIIDKGYLTQSEALSFVAKQYTAGEKLLSDPTKTWNDYKKYNLSVKVENLGDVNSTSAQSYVTPFAEGVKALYNTLKEAGKQASNYLPTEVTEADLIQTNYGFHVLTSIGTNTLSNAHYSNEEKKYSYTWNGQEKTDVTITNSEQDWPTKTQIEVYLAVGSSQVENAVTTPIEYTFTTFSSRYATAQFQNIYFIYNNILEGIKLSNPDLKYLVNYLQVQKNTIDSYKDYSQTADNAFAGWWEAFGCNK